MDPFAIIWMLKHAVYQSKCIILAASGNITIYIKRDSSNEQGDEQRKCHDTDLHQKTWKDQISKL